MVSYGMWIPTGAFSVISRTVRKIALRCMSGYGMMENSEQPMATSLLESLEQQLITWRSNPEVKVLEKAVISRFMDCFDVGMDMQAYELAKKYGWYQDA